mmetsp:Transcript_40054/g.73998  ORF Transcript_40054/g.73998 Transcript_40054/m.73998 type:complete len:119 (-) Transcript_40054:767-1123(-)
MHTICSTQAPLLLFSHISATLPSRFLKEHQASIDDLDAVLLGATFIELQRSFTTEVECTILLTRKAAISLLSILLIRRLELILEQLRGFLPWQMLSSLTRKNHLNQWLLDRPQWTHPQ